MRTWLVLSVAAVAPSSAAPVLAQTCVSQSSGATTVSSCADGSSAVTTHEGTTSETVFSDGVTALTTPLGSGSQVSRLSDGSVVTTTCIGGSPVSEPGATHSAPVATTACS